jgi:hypothetical protein
MRLRKDYSSAFLGYLTRRDEKGLRAAYEIGRRAMSKGISLLDLVQVHHDVLLDALSTAKSDTEFQDGARAAAAFLVEALASFEMTQRGFIAKIGPGVTEKR